MTDDIHSCGPWTICPACINQRISESEEQRKRIAELEVENAEWKEKAKVWLASPDARRHLAGYRELAGKCAALESERDALKSRVELLEVAFASAFAAKGE